VAPVLEDLGEYPMAFVHEGIIFERQPRKPSRLELLGVGSH
jgi:hypothetical protein